jgi:hypothetical protein
MNDHTFSAPGWTILALLAISGIAALAPARLIKGRSEYARWLLALAVPGTLTVVWLLAAAFLPASQSTGLHLSSRAAILAGLPLLALIVGFATWGDDDRHDTVTFQGIGAADARELETRAILGPPETAAEMYAMSRRRPIAPAAYIRRRSWTGYAIRVWIGVSGCTLLLVLLMALIQAGTPQP